MLRTLNLHAYTHKSMSDPTNASGLPTQKTLLGYSFGDNTGLAVYVYVCVVLNWNIADDRKPEILKVYTRVRA